MRILVQLIVATLLALNVYGIYILDAADAVKILTLARFMPKPELQQNQKVIGQNASPPVATTEAAVP